jgi:hypothetical protein
LKSSLLLHEITTTLITLAYHNIPNIFANDRYLELEPKNVLAYRNFKDLHPKKNFPGHRVGIRCRHADLRQTIFYLHSNIFWPNFVENGRTHAVKFPLPNFAELKPKLAEIFPNCPNQSWVKFRSTWTIFDQDRPNCTHATVLKRISAKKYCISLPVIIFRG